MSQRVLRSQSDAIDDMNVSMRNLSHEKNESFSETIQNTITNQKLIANKTQTSNSFSKTFEIKLKTKYERLTTMKTRALLR